MASGRSSSRYRGRDDVVGDGSDVPFLLLGGFLSILGLILFSLLIRFGVSLHPYSGEHNPPMYGDYEAQRHWMEITTNLPLDQWYINGTDNDLEYWGLDYPPLTAYHSWLCGKIGSLFEPSAFALGSSRGWETYTSRLYMRGTVIAADIFLYIPAVALAVHCIAKVWKPEIQQRLWKPFETVACSSNIKLWICLLLQPSLVLIDHGHFQYNNVSLGFALLGAAFVMVDWDLAGSMCYCLSLCYKQMSLYFALPFFFFLLGKAVYSQATWTGTLLKIAQLGTVVFVTFALCWAPFALSMDHFTSVLSRIFPTGRGLFEDKVASFWCAISPLIKFKVLLTTETLVPLCGVVTLLASLPSNCMAFAYSSKPHMFLLSLFATGMSFFMFSFHVHEKTILLPLLPATCLSAQYPFLSAWMNVIASFSILPLLQRDGLWIPYVSLTYLVYVPLVWNDLVSLPDGVRRIFSSNGANKESGALSICWNCYVYGSIAAMMALHVALGLGVSPPQRFPHIWTLLVAVFCFGQFFAMYVYANVLMVQSMHSTSSLKSKPLSSSSSSSSKKRKKKTS